jgi:hypothetical protein
MSYAAEQKIKDAVIDVLMENNIYDRCKLKLWCGIGFGRGNMYLYKKVNALLKLRQYNIEYEGGRHTASGLLNYKYVIMENTLHEVLPGYVNFVGPSIRERLMKKAAEKAAKDKVRNEMWRKFQKEVECDLEGHLNTSEMHNCVKKWTNLLMDRNCPKK